MPWVIVDEENKIQEFTDVQETLPIGPGRQLPEVRTVRKMSVTKDGAPVMVRNPNLVYWIGTGWSGDKNARGLAIQFTNKAQAELIGKTFGRAFSVEEI